MTDHSPSAPDRATRRRLAIRLSAAAAVLAFIVCAAWYATRAEPVAVQTARVDTGRVEATVANTRAGSVSACRRAKLAPPAAGRIEVLKIRKGDRVKTGQVLLELWNEDLLARDRLAQEQLLTATAHVREVCELAKVAASDARRSRGLVARGFISSQALERADADASSRSAACESSKAQVKEAGARIAGSRADIARTVLKAPFDGVVAEVNGEIGEYLTPSPPGIPTLPAVDLIDDSCLYVSAPIDEIDAARLRVGMPARVTLDAYRGKHFVGKVRRVAPYVLAQEKQARTVEVEVQLDNPDPAHYLLVGYSADVEIVTDAHDPVLRVPTTALRSGNAVLVLTAGGKLEARKLDTGLSNWEFTEVKAGLERGARVVTSLDRSGVRAGAAAVEEQPAPAGGTAK
ncbi:efflux RND transporter periplasmic adaptor subunit [Cupriavidus sp. D39]|uniref:efflux RND transporter periplasmic adaptor subunit n=1 Tax=Cupriavidus sp. D39 TaxID=2997877 RepID=UPI002271D991|nr:efflux RND transporter periplasmic adaptor subunit [Cupriavidus sp. D39]MCY0854523.1 efflux RND transporter periplasmic adaptor subunit [Cupriavidus sp. D39]